MISFIIPCFNGKEALRNTLRSFEWQSTQVEFEVILIDNNSTRDNLDELYHEFIDSLNIYLIKQPKLESTYALCKARNLGLSIASYDWVATLDSDIILPPHYIENAVKYLQSQSQVMVCGKRIFILRDDIEPLTKEKLASAPQVPSSSNYNKIIDRRMPYLNNLHKVEQPWAFFHGCNTIFEKNAALAIGGYNEEFDGYWGYEDIDFAHRMISQKQVTPVYREDLFVYHQEEEIAGVLNRFDKSSNPNWTLICNIIPGFKAFKLQQYESINKGIVLSK